MEPWILPILLLLVGIGVAVMAVFFPSGGILEFLSVCAVVAAVFKAFYEETALGLIVLAITLFGIPVVVVAALKWWPRTALGRKFLLMAPTSSEVLPENNPRQLLEGLIGHVGHAKSKMLPSGIIVIEKQTYDAVSEGMPIEPGQRVRVIEVRGNRLIVEATGDEPPSANDEDPLARPFEEE